ncbi:MAG: ribosome recycling factor [Candidatus Dasytiphilus stammeri]
MITQIKTNTEMQMEKCVSTFNYHINKIRTGRVTPSLIDNITIEYYGVVTPLRNISNIIVEDYRTLVITVFDRDLISSIEKSIRASDLGLNPNTAGTVIRIILPSLTEERRNQLSKLVRSEAEQSKVCIRNVRRDANLKIKSLLKSKKISQDEEHRTQDKIQKITDDYIEKIDEIMNIKIKDLRDF